MFLSEIDSRVGNYRKENQDAVDVMFNQHFALLILCDGMGGHYGGALASKNTIKVFKKEFMGPNFPINSSDINDYVTWFKTCTKKAITKMVEIANGDEAKLDMGTTVTAALINNKTEQMTIFNIGDSRTYLFSVDGELKQITTDQNLLNDLIYNKGFSEKEAKLVPNWAALMSALGPYKRRFISVTNVESKSFKRIHAVLVTCDGIHDYVSKRNMEQIISDSDEPKQILNNLIEEALSNKSTDNVSGGIIIFENHKKTWGGQ